MSRLRAVAVALTLGSPFVASAADITRVASSFEDDDPFGLFVDVGFEHTERRTKILREVFSGPRGRGNSARDAAPRCTTRGLNLDVAGGHLPGRGVLLRAALRLPAERVLELRDGRGRGTPPWNQTPSPGMGLRRQGRVPNQGVPQRPGQRALRAGVGDSSTRRRTTPSPRGWSAGLRGAHGQGARSTWTTRAERRRRLRGRPRAQVHALHGVLATDWRRGALLQGVLDHPGARPRRLLQLPAPRDA